jgi:D-arginine dehydrogenase
MGQCDEVIKLTRNKLIYVFLHIDQNHALVVQGGFGLPCILEFDDRHGMYDYLIIGAGISGAGAAYELAAHGNTLMIEAETTPGYHSTGRSAALFTRNYGNPVVRRINQASHAFFLNPPEGFCETPLLTPRGSLTIASPENIAGLDAILDLSTAGHEIERITAARALELAPLLRTERVASAAYEPGVTDINVAGLHQGYLRGFKQRGGTLLCGKRIDHLEQTGRGWQIFAGDTILAARIIVNAAGAWAGHVGKMAGTKRIELIPKRRTAIVVDGPLDMQTSTMPAVDFIGTHAYLKPDAGRVMASPGDETPTEPQDAQPDEFDIAVLVEWLETETLIKVRRIGSSWAGLRSFVSDERPVVGFDTSAEGFFWLAGQGGYGIMMAPALAKATVGLITANEIPELLLDANVTKMDIDPQRPQQIA